MVMGRWPTLHDENRRDFLSKPRSRTHRDSYGGPPGSRGLMWSTILVTAWGPSPGTGPGVYPLGVLSCLGQQTTRIFGPHAIWDSLYYWDKGTYRVIPTSD